MFGPAGYPFSDFPSVVPISVYRDSEGRPFLSECTIPSDICRQQGLKLLGKESYWTSEIAFSNFIAGLIRKGLLPDDTKYESAENLRALFYPYELAHLNEEYAREWRDAEQKICEKGFIFDLPDTPLQLIFTPVDFENGIFELQFKFEDLDSHGSIQMEIGHLYNKNRKNHAARSLQALHNRDLAYFGIQPFRSNQFQLRVTYLEHSNEDKYLIHERYGLLTIWQHSSVEWVIGLEYNNKDDLPFKRELVTINKGDETLITREKLSESNPTQYIPELSYLETTVRDPKAVYALFLYRIREIPNNLAELRISEMFRCTTSALQLFGAAAKHCESKGIDTRELLELFSDWSKAAEDALQMLQSLDSKELSCLSHIDRFSLLIHLCAYADQKKLGVFSDLNGTLANFIRGDGWEFFRNVEGNMLSLLRVAPINIVTGATVDNVINKWLLPHRWIHPEYNGSFYRDFEEIGNLRILCRAGVEMLSFDQEGRLIEQPLVGGVLPYEMEIIERIVNEVSNEYKLLERFSVENHYIQIPGGFPGLLQKANRNGIVTYAYSPAGLLDSDSREYFVQQPENHLLLRVIADEINSKLRNQGIYSISFLRSGDKTLDGVPTNKGDTVRKLLSMNQDDLFPIFIADKFYEKSVSRNGGKVAGNDLSLLTTFHDRGIFIAVTEHEDPVDIFGDFNGLNMLCIKPELVHVALTEIGSVSESIRALLKIR